MKPSKRLTVCIYVIYVLTSLNSFGQLSGTSYAEAQKTRIASWTFDYTETPSFASKQSNGLVQGLAVDVMKKFAEYVQRTEGIKVSYAFKGKDHSDFNGFMQEVKAGRGGVFGLGNITITEARKRDYNFSPAFIKNISLLCTHMDVPTLTSLNKAAEAFANFRGIAVTGSTNEKAVLNLKAKYIPTAVIRQVESNQEAIEAIATDKKAFTNTDFTFYMNAQRQGLPIKRHPVGDESSEEFGIIMPKSNDWAPLMNKFLTTEFLRSSDYKKILYAHIGANGVKLMESFGQR
jgi:ABC-type amino acid transport substrate-binding protein